MATQELYEPIARLRSVFFSTQCHQYLWGGRTVDFETGSEDTKIQLVTRIEQFDPYLEVWGDQLTTTGTPHPGLDRGACALLGDRAYIYGGRSGKRCEGVLSVLNLETLTWSQLSQEDTAGGPMRKTDCGMVCFNGDKLAVIGGYGFPTGPIQPEAKFLKRIKFRDGRGWTNEIHIYDINRNQWSSPTVKGDRPLPCGGFSLTSIDNHRSVFFGGFQPKQWSHVNDLYIIDFDTMVLYVRGNNTMNTLSPPLK